MKHSSFTICLLFFSLHIFAQATLEIDGALKLGELWTLSNADQFTIGKEGELILNPANPPNIETEVPRSIQYHPDYEDYGANYEVGMYYKHDRRVYLGGLVRKASGGNIFVGDTIGYIEREYWPAERIVAYGFQGNATVRIHIYPDGYFRVASIPANTWDFISLEGIQFDRSNEIGLHTEGGIIFYLADPPADLDGDGYLDNGLVCALEDLTPNVPFGCMDTYIVDAISDIGSGYQNSMLIVDACDDQDIAARQCLDYVANGYDDWFLPSEKELELMFNNLADSDGNGQNDGVDDPSNLANFQLEHYHSSTQMPMLQEASMRIRFIDGDIGGYLKDVNHRVRPIRVF